MDKTINFSDIFKKGFLEQFSFNSPLSLSRIVITLLITFAIGLFIFFIYKKTFRGVLYTRSLNVSLLMLSLVTALIIMPISSNVVLSLGMVGALSIVRFRTAIKDPIDIVFMFWAISVGISNGAGLFLVSLVGSIVIGIILFCFTYFNFSISSPFLLIIRYNHDAVIPLNKIVPKYNLKSKTVTRESVELTLELRIKNSDTGFMSDLLKIEGVLDAVLVSYNGEYAS